MKKIAAIVIPAFIASVGLFSCREDGTQGDVEPVAVDSTILEPQIKVSYQILDSGWVQFYNQTTDIKVTGFGWHTYWGYNAYEQNPKYWFPNGTHQVDFSIMFPDKEYPQFSSDWVDTTLVINISNSIPVMENKRFVKGIIFGDIVDTVSSYRRLQNEFHGVGDTQYNAETPVAFVTDRKSFTVVLGDLNTVKGTDVQKMRDLFKVGKAPLAKFKTIILENGNIVTDVQESDGWSLFFHHRFSGGTEIAYAGTNEKNESLEIMDVREVYQPPVFPGMETTAFIVTFHYKGRLWGRPISASYTYPKIEGRDEIDLTFDVKFNVYPKEVFF